MPTQKINLSVSDGTTMQAYVSAPEGNGPFPGVIVFQEAFGVNAHIRDIADRIAKEGYVAIAPELFHRTAPAGFEGSYTDFSTVAQHVQAVKDETLSADMKTTFDWLQQQANVKKDHIGCIGFCMGGRVSFIANSELPFSAAISFYGGQLWNYASRAPQLHAPQLFFWGGLDKHILPENRDTVIKAVEAAGKPYVNVVISNADHGFNCDARASYNREAANEAWAMAMAFFKNYL